MNDINAKFLMKIKSIQWNEKYSFMREESAQKANFSPNK